MVSTQDLSRNYFYNLTRNALGLLPWRGGAGRGDGVVPQFCGTKKGFAVARKPLSVLVGRTGFEPVTNGLKVPQRIQ